MQYTVYSFATGLLYGGVIALALSGILIKSKSHVIFIRTIPARAVFLLVLVYLIVDYVQFEDRYSLIGEASAAAVCFYLLRGWWLPSRSPRGFEYPELAESEAEGPLLPSPSQLASLSDDAREDTDPREIWRTLRRWDRLPATSPSPLSREAMLVAYLGVNAIRDDDHPPALPSEARELAEAATIASTVLPGAEAGVITRYSSRASNGKDLRRTSAAEAATACGLARDWSSHDESPSEVPGVARGADGPTNRLVAHLRGARQPVEAATVVFAALLNAEAGVIAKRSSWATNGEDLERLSFAATAEATSPVRLERSGHDEIPSEAPDAADVTDGSTHHLIAQLREAQRPEEAEGTSFPSPGSGGVPSLAELFCKWETDSAREYYAGIYECLFHRSRSDIKAVLEVGIGTMPPTVQSSTAGDVGELYRTGGSLRAWRDYFENAVIYGLDVQPVTQFRDERIMTGLCDTTNSAAVRRLMEGNFATAFDIIIDVSSRSADDQLATLNNLFPYLRENGFYIVEDLVGNGFRTSLPIVRAICGDCPAFCLGPENNLFALLKPANSERDDRSINRLLTKWGTALYVDENSGSLRHGPTNATPANVRLLFDGQKLMLAHTTRGSPRPIACAIDGSALAADGNGGRTSGTRLSYVWSGSWDPMWFGLEADGLYLCAEQDHRVTLSRKVLRDWECFALPGVSRV
jgi:hypothetical protein